MKGRTSQATWLELASVRHIDQVEATPAVMLHCHDAAKGRCVTLSLDGRPVVENSGQITAFRDLAAAERFLNIAGITEYRRCDNDTEACSPCGSALCLSLGHAGLVACSSCPGAASARKSIAA